MPIHPRCEPAAVRTCAGRSAIMGYVNQRGTDSGSWRSTHAEVDGGNSCHRLGLLDVDRTLDASSLGRALKRGW